MGQSDIAHLRKRIEEEYQASRRVFTDFTPTAKHEYITKRQENIGIYFEELSKLMSPEEAIAIVAETLNALQSPCSLSGNTS